MWEKYFPSFFADEMSVLSMAVEYAKEMIICSAVDAFTNREIVLVSPVWIAGLEPFNGCYRRRRVFFSCDQEARRVSVSVPATLAVLPSRHHTAVCLEEQLLLLLLRESLLRLLRLLERSVGRDRSSMQMRGRHGWGSIRSSQARERHGDRR